MVQRTVLDQAQRSFRPQEAFRWSLTPVLTDRTGERRTELKAPEKVKIAYLVGSDLNEEIVHDPRVPIYNQGSTDLDELRVTGRTKYERVHVTKGYYRQRFRYRLDGYEYLLNLVTDPDQHPRVLRNLVRLVEGFRGRIVNHPATVLRATRENVARWAAHLPNVHAPKVLRIASSSPRVVLGSLEKAGFAFPVLLRLPGTHGGSFLGLFDDPEALADALVPGLEHIVTEFVDFRSEDGLYRKYRVFFFGEQRILRHMLVADHWNIHAENGNAFMLRNPALLEEERRLFADPDAAFEPRVISALEDIRRAVGLDYLGIDFGFTPDGKVLLFEANATMNFFPFREEEALVFRKACLEPAQRAFEALIGVGPSPADPKPKKDSRRCPVNGVPPAGDELLRQIVETDRRYFEMGTERMPVPGAEIVWMGGLAHCPSAAVAHRVDPSVVERDGAAWVRRVEDALSGLGATFARIYTDSDDPAVADVLGSAGYEMRHELALSRPTAGLATQSIELREVISAEDWERKLRFHEAVTERPDGHDASAEDWVALERRKCAHGMRAFLAWRDGDLVGAIGVIPSAGPWRLKNIVVHSEFRRQAVGRGMIAGIAELARGAGAEKLCLFGVEGTVGEALYRACGFVGGGYQLEWSRDLGAS